MLERKSDVYKRQKNVVPAGAVYLAIQDPFVREDGPLDRDVAWKELKKKLRMAGTLVDNIEVLRLMDETSSTYSDILPVRFTKTGVSSGSQVVSEDDLRMLLQYVREKIKNISIEILSGRMDIAPYRRNQIRACTYCPFCLLYTSRCV